VSAAVAGIAIDRARLLAGLEDFARIGATEAGGVDRQAFTVGDQAARRSLAERALARGFRVEQDAAANLFVRRGTDPRPPLLIGSHLDTQPKGGRFDGALGTLAAFEVLEALEDAGAETALPVAVVAWANEEGCRFAPGTMGSRAFALRAPPDPRTVDARGGTLADALAATRAALPESEEAPLGFPLSGYLELHIEQGPVLERLGLPLAAVEGIQGTRWLAVTVSGSAAHAGTTPLEARHDPVAAMAEALSRLQRTVMPNDPDARVTAGRIEAMPGSINTIAAEARCTLDLRHPDPDRLQELEQRARSAFAAAAAEHGCRAHAEPLFAQPPTRFDPVMVDCVERAAALAGYACRRMISGAFHDAQPIAAVAPAAMIFVPCRDGISHSEAEFVAPEHATAGAETLLRASLLAAAALAARAGRQPA
jgi:N-carbamoyl-L-amino-acid hydrolase